MGKRANLTRQCGACKSAGKQAEHVTFPYHEVRRIVCSNRRCRKQSATLELFLGAPVGRGPRVGQAQVLLRALLARDSIDAKAKVKVRNARYSELIDFGAVLETNAIRTCISCGEPGRPLYSSNYGHYTVRAYRCTDLECAERWLAAEYLMGELLGDVDWSNLDVCLNLVREVATQIDEARRSKSAAKRAATSAIHAKRARLMEQLEQQNPRILPER